MAPGVFFRALLIGYFEGLDSERGIARRVADSLSLRGFLGFGLNEETLDHSTISRTRRLYWLETHKAVFKWVVRILTGEGLIEGQTIAINATTLEANAAMKSIVRRAFADCYLPPSATSGISSSRPRRCFRPTNLLCAAKQPDLSLVAYQYQPITLS